MNEVMGVPKRLETLQPKKQIQSWGIAGPVWMLYVVLEEGPAKGVAFVLRIDFFTVKKIQRRHSYSRGFHVRTPSSYPPSSQKLPKNPSLDPALASSRTLLFGML